MLKPGALATFFFAASLLASAQRAGFVVPPFGPAPVSSPAGATVSFGPGRLSHGLGRSFLPGEVFLGDGFWAGDYTLYNPQPPSVIYVQAPPAATAPAAPEERHAAPALLIEWQGDRYVRYTSASTKPGHSAAQLDYAEPANGSPATSIPGRLQAGTRVQPSQELAVAQLPTVLIFRDGRQQEVSNYAIVGQTIYVGSDYWVSGAWQQTVPIAQLDLPATMRLNQARGVKFTLPSSPNEVVTRP